MFKGNRLHRDVAGDERDLVRPARGGLVATGVPGLFLLAAFLGHVPAHASTISNFDASLNAGNTGNYAITGPRREFESILQDTPGANGGCALYQCVLAVDVAAGGNTESEGANARYQVSFTITAVPAEAWTVRVNSRWKGALTIVNDSGNDAVAAIVSPGITATCNIGGTLTPLQFASDSESNPGTPSTSRDKEFTQQGEALINGTGPASVVINFSWDMNVISHGSISGGDEAAVRLGTHTTGTNRISAGDYPGPGGRTEGTLPDNNGDGHFVCVDLCRQPACVIQKATLCHDNLSLDPPCTFTTTGVTEGCVQNNYTVVLTYVDKNGGFVTNDFIVVTNGALAWSSSIHDPLDCAGAPYDVHCFIVDTPGRPEIYPDTGPAPNIDGNPEAVVRVGTSSCFNPEPAMKTPGLGPWGRALLILFVAALGVGLLRQQGSS